MARDVQLNSGGVEALLRSEAVREGALRPVAQAVAGRARAGAPVESGEYRNRIEVESATTDRAVERVVARARHSAVVEAKTGNLKRAMGGA